MDLFTHLKEVFNMKIAIPFDQGMVYPHFGHAECFKVYTVEDGVVTASELVSANGEGHDAMAAQMAALGVNVVICGGIGAGAQAALAAAGIELCSGAEGEADAMAAAYLAGALASEGANCGCGGEDGCQCGGDCACGDDGEGCGSGCGGCGGCGARRPAFEGKNVGKTVKAHYRGTFNDGTQFDASYDRGEPLEFVCGAGMMILGFDKAVANMNVSDTADIHLMPEEAYGPVNPNAIFTLPIAQLPGSEELSVGQQVYLTTDYGQPFPVKVTAKDDTMITLDANHEMAGKELNFHIELVEVL